MGGTNNFENKIDLQTSLKKCCQLVDVDGKEIDRENNKYSCVYLKQAIFFAV